MDQVISALDAIRGSSEWRRHDKSSDSRQEANRTEPLGCLSLVTTEGNAETFGKAALEAGAGGATIIPYECRAYSSEKESLSGARETCDLIIPGTLQEKIFSIMSERGIFEENPPGTVEIIAVHDSVSYSS
jgi:hypothetical protein